MVKLPEESSQSARTAGLGRRSGLRPSRSHHNWGSRFGRRREEMRQNREPTDLQELEVLTERAVELMEKHGIRTERNYTIAMGLLREQYNLNFKIICKKCGGVHNRTHDDLSAPER